MPDVLEALDAIPVAQVPAAIARLTTRLMTPPDPADELLDVAQVAALLRVPPKFVYAHADDLGAVRLSRRKVRFSRKTVTRYIERRKR
jgi:excisionase family DNA binding protein